MVKGTLLLVDDQFGDYPIWIDGHHNHGYFLGREADLDFFYRISSVAESFTKIQRFLEHLCALKTDAVQILASTNVETSLAWDMTDSECAGWLAAYDGDDLKEFES